MKKNKQARQIQRTEVYECEMWCSWIEFEGLLGLGGGSRPPESRLSWGIL